MSDAGRSEASEVATPSPPREADLGQPLLGPYRWRRLAPEEMSSAFARLRAQVFGSTMSLDPGYARGSEPAVAPAIPELDQRYALRIGVFLDHSLVAWHFGWQVDAGTYVMTSSAVLPGHQRRGIYSALLRVVLEEVRSAGFTSVTSRHAMTNNAILIAKLRAGFVIQGLEVDDVFGALVRLVHLSEPLRREVLDFRVGARPTPAVRRLWPDVLRPPDRPIDP